MYAYQNLFILCKVTNYFLLICIIMEKSASFLG